MMKSRSDHALEDIFSRLDCLSERWQREAAQESTWQANAPLMRFMGEVADLLTAWESYCDSRQREGVTA